MLLERCGVAGKVRSSAEDKEGTGAEMRRVGMSAVKADLATLTRPPATSQFLRLSRLTIQAPSSLSTEFVWTICFRWRVLFLCLCLERRTRASDKNGHDSKVCSRHAVVAIVYISTSRTSCLYSIIAPAKKNVVSAISQTPQPLPLA